VSAQHAPERVAEAVARLRAELLRTSVALTRLADELGPIKGPGPDVVRQGVPVVVGAAVPAGLALHVRDDPSGRPGSA
jgi:hypothetical protein